MTLDSYGAGLELCFAVNAVFTVWGGLYKGIVRRQEALLVGAAAVDRVLAAEQSIETIAVRNLRRSIQIGGRARQVLWWLARFAGAVFATAIYVGAVCYADAKLPNEVTVCGFSLASWSTVEMLVAYASPGLVLLMVLVSFIANCSASCQLKQLQDVASVWLKKGYDTVRKDLPPTPPSPFD